MEDKSQSWNDICLESIRREKAEAAKRYNIRFGQTEMHCAHCGRPVTNPLNHMCQDIRLKKLSETPKASLKKTPELCFKLRRLGVKKASILLYLEENGVVLRDVGERTVRGWIQRENAPVEYQEAVGAL